MYVNDKLISERLKDVEKRIKELYGANCSFGYNIRINPGNGQEPFGVYCGEVFDSEFCSAFDCNEDPDDE